MMILVQNLGGKFGVENAEQVRVEVEEEKQVEVEVDVEEKQVEDVGVEVEEDKKLNCIILQAIL